MLFMAFRIIGRNVISMVISYRELEISTGNNWLPFQHHPAQPNPQEHERYAQNVAESDVQQRVLNVPV
jgi:hypothetical protein